MVPLRLALALAFTLVATFGMGVLVYQTTSLGLPWNNSSAESWGEVNKHSDFEKKNGSFNWTSPLSIFFVFSFLRNPKVLQIEQQPICVKKPFVFSLVWGSCTASCLSWNISMESPMRRANGSWFFQPRNLWWTWKFQWKIWKMNDLEGWFVNLQIAVHLRISGFFARNKRDQRIKHVSV